MIFLFFFIRLHLFASFLWMLSLLLYLCIFSLNVYTDPLSPSLTNKSCVYAQIREEYSLQSRVLPVFENKGIVFFLHNSSPRGAVTPQGPILTLFLTMRGKLDLILNKHEHKKNHSPPLFSKR